MGRLTLMGAGYNPASGPPWTPADLGSTLKMWLQPTGLPGADNDPIDTWTDSSGNGHDALQANASEKPLKKTNILNGLPVARFDGSNDSMKTDILTPLSLPDVTFAAVVKLSATSNYPMIMTMNSAQGELRYHATGSQPAMGVLAASADWGSHVGTTDFSILIGTFNDTTNEVTIRVSNGTPVTNTDASSWTATSPLTIGARQGGSLFLTGDIAELIACDTVISSGNISSLVTYWQSKFGIS